MTPSYLDVWEDGRPGRGNDFQECEVNQDYITRFLTRSGVP